MNLRVAATVEFDKVANMVAGHAVCGKTAQSLARMRPSSDERLCTKWLDETESAVSYILKRGKPPIRPLIDTEMSLHIARAGGMLRNRELLQIRDVLGVSRGIRDHLAEFEDREGKAGYGPAELLISGMYTNRRLEDKISHAILSEDEIADDASPALRNIRRNIIREQDAVREKLNSLIRNPAISKYLQDPVVTIRKDRYVIPVKAEYRNEIKGLLHDASSSGQTFFIEPLSVLESNNRIRELENEQEAEIERILRELSADAGEVSENISGSAAAVFKLDFMFAKASWALETNSVRPAINSEGRISIKKGRHPLIPAKQVVPIDFEMGNGITCVVITGPNTGGKTVTLKTVGLFTLMAQAGLFIPAAAGSSISLYREVFADIGDEQSIEQSLSTFSSHMKNIVHILDRARSSHLVLLDELGAGTDPVEGAALAVSVLEYLRARNVSSIATTHYSELKMYALNTEGVINASCEFDIETLRPTYRLLIGIPGKSNAFEISKKLGLKQSVIENARTFISKKDMDFESTISKLQQYKAELERDRELAAKYREEAEALREKTEKQRQLYEERKQAVIREARLEAYELTEKAKKDINRVMEELGQLASARERIDINRRLNLLLEENSVPREAEMPDFDISEDILSKPLKTGDTVFSKKLNTQGIIINGPDEHGETMVQAGAMKVRLPVSDLKAVSKKTSVKEVRTGGQYVSKAMEIRPEIDIRGETVTDAEAMLDKYLDDAHLAGLGQATVIHGKGTGSLRAGVIEYLKHNPHVKSFRAGQTGEGESGVTVITLR